MQRGDVVAVQLPNSPEFVIAYLAICRLGAAMCTLHMPYRSAEIEALMRHGKARLAVCLPNRKEMFGGLGVAFAEIGDDALLAPNHPQPEAADVFLLLYTSGTTASPKGVPHPYRTMLSNARLGAPEHSSIRAIACCARRRSRTSMACTRCIARGRRRVHGAAAGVQAG